MMSPLEPKRGIRPQQNTVPNVLTEIALRWLDEAPALKKSQSVTSEIGARMLGLKKSFASMNPEGRVSLLVQLAKKESEVKTRLDAEERKGEYAFPEGDVLTGGLIRALPPAEAQRAFWDVLAVLGNDDRSDERNREMSPGTTPASVVYDFVEHARKSFSFQDWHDIGASLLNAYGHDTRIPEKIREYGIKSYFDCSFGEDISDVIIRAQNRSSMPSYLKEHDALVDRLLELQPAIGSLILDKRLGNSLRRQMLRYAPFRLCQESVRGKIVKLSYAPDTGEELACGIINWLKFPGINSKLEATDTYDVLEKVVQKRKETPSLQLYAMRESLEHDSYMAPGSMTRSNIRKFTKVLDKIWETTPERAQPESPLYGLLTKSADGGRYITRHMIGSDNALRRITGVYAALNGNRSLLSDHNIVRRCINDIITELKDVNSRSFCYTVAERLCDTASFTRGDGLLLRGLKNSLKTFHDHGAATAVEKVDDVLWTLPK